METVKTNPLRASRAMVLSAARRTSSAAIGTIEVKNKPIKRREIGDFLPANPGKEAKASEPDINCRNEAIGTSETLRFAPGDRPETPCGRLPNEPK
jgi:hypothetical protein